MASLGRVFSSLSMTGGGVAGQRWSCTEGPQIRDINGPRGGSFTCSSPHPPFALPRAVLSPFRSWGYIVGLLFAHPPPPGTGTTAGAGVGTPPGTGRRSIVGPVEISQCSVSWP